MTEQTNANPKRAFRIGDHVICNDFCFGYKNAFGVVVADDGDPEGIAPYLVWLTEQEETRRFSASNLTRRLPPGATQTDLAEAHWRSVAMRRAIWWCLAGWVVGFWSGVTGQWVAAWLSGQ